MSTKPRSTHNLKLATFAVAFAAATDKPHLDLVVASGKCSGNAWGHGTNRRRRGGRLPKLSPIGDGGFVLFHSLTREIVVSSRNTGISTTPRKDRF